MRNYYKCFQWEKNPWVGGGDGHRKQGFEYLILYILLTKYTFILLSHPTAMIHLEQ